MALVRHLHQVPLPVLPNASFFLSAHLPAKMVYSAVSAHPLSADTMLPTCPFPKSFVLEAFSVRNPSVLSLGLEHRIIQMDDLAFLSQQSGSLS